MKKLVTIAFVLLALTIPGQGQDPTRRPSSQGPSNSSLACCRCVGEVTTINLSTGQTSPIDSLWKVNGGPAYTTPPVPGWATIAGANWIQPVASPTPSSNIPPGVFKYTLQFNVPKCTIPSEVRLDGTFAADNGVNVSLDGNSLTSCPSPYCFKAPAKALTANGIGPGTHTLTFEVKNEGGPSGLIVNAKLTRQCQK